MTTALLFPGQGTQHVGMGKDLFDLFPDLTDSAEDVLGYSLRRLCLHDPDRVLGHTRFTQPAVYVVNALALRRGLWKGMPRPTFCSATALASTMPWKPPVSSPFSPASSSWSNGPVSWTASTAPWPPSPAWRYRKSMRRWPCPGRRVCTSPPSTHPGKRSSPGPRTHSRRYPPCYTTLERELSAVSRSAARSTVPT